MDDRFGDRQRRLFRTVEQRLLMQQVRIMNQRLNAAFGQPRAPLFALRGLHDEQVEDVFCRCVNQWRRQIKLNQ